MYNSRWERELTVSRFGIIAALGNQVKVNSIGIEQVGR